MEDHKLRFIDWGLINVLESNQDCGEKSDVSLDLTLSLGNTSSQSSSKPSDNYHKEKKSIIWMEKNGNALSDSDTDDDDDDISLDLELSLSLNNHKKRKRAGSSTCMEKSGCAVSSGLTNDDDLSLELSLSLPGSNLKPKDAFTSLSSGWTDDDYDPSLELSLSLPGSNLKPKDANFTSNKAGKSMESTCMEKSGCALSSGWTDDDDHLSLELPLSVNPGFEVSEGSESNKGKPMVPDRKYKRRKVETVRLAANDPWCIKKKLFKSDLGDNARLLLASSSVEAHVFPHWNEDQLALIETKDGLPVSVWDRDMESAAHGMKFKRWSNGANVLIGNWLPEFVKRRQLMQGDEIGLYWDIQTSRFVFSVLTRAPRQQQQ